MDRNTHEDRLLQLIRDETQAGHTYSANGIENAFGGENGRLSAGKLKVREAVKHLIAAGSLRKQGRARHLVPLAGSPPNAKP